MKISNKRKIEELRPLHNGEIIRRDDNSIYERFKIGKLDFISAYILDELMVVVELCVQIGSDGVMVRTYHGTDYDNNKCSYGRGYKKCPKKYTKYFEEINNLQKGALNV